MAWNRWYSLRSYVGSALWIVPVISIGLYGVVWNSTAAFEDWLAATGRLDQTTALLGLQPAGAQTLLGTIVTLTLSFMVFTFGSLLVAIQIAGGQYTPRIIATALLRDNVIRFTVGLFIFALLFTLKTQDHSPDTVRQLCTFMSGLLGIACLINFLYLIDYAARMLRPVSLLTGVGEQGVAVIEQVYPHPSAEADAPPERSAARGEPRQVIQHAGKSAVVIAVSLERLVEEARNAGAVIELVPRVGDFLAHGQPLFRLYEGAAADDRRLRAAVAFGPERTIDQDPMFAFRIVVDIALKALSPAINDPTTAVLAVDQLHWLLRAVGGRALHGEEIVDHVGRTRVIFRTPNWEDFVHLALTEIRHCGVSSVQVTRRLHAMLEDLVRGLPDHRQVALRRELALLERTIARQHAFPEDAALARVPDSQGLGGSGGR